MLIKNSSDTIGLLEGTVFDHRSLLEKKRKRKKLFPLSHLAKPKSAVGNDSDQSWGVFLRSQVVPELVKALAQQGMSD
jgi:hypothetical protein